VTVELILGDCLQVMRDMADKSIDAVITDPPYGISYQSSRRTDRDSRFPIISGDEVLSLDWIYETFRITKDNGCLFCFCRWDTEQQFKEIIIDAGYKLQSQVIWDRGVHGLGDLKRQYAPMHDNALFSTKNDFEFPNNRPKSVYRIDRVSADKLQHPTQKPTGLMNRIAIDLSTKNDTILDPFMGSGTTGVACVQLNRNFIGIEICEEYFNIAQKRIHDAQQQPGLFERANNAE